MKLHIFIIVLFCRIFVIENSAIARGPAVEPVTGLSIEEYNQTFPNKKSGFNFNYDKASLNLKKKNNSRTIAATNRAPERSIESLYDKSGSEYAFLIILGVLPFIIWLGLMKTLDNIEMKYQDQKPYLVSDDEDNEKKNDQDNNFPNVS